MTPKNGSRVTNRDLLDAVQGLHGRIDRVNGRIDDSAKELARTGRGMVSLEGCVRSSIEELRSTVNDSLHAMDDRVRVLEMPWKMIGRGRVWFAAGLGMAVGAATLLTQLGVWPF